ncbi:MAG: hypothetical protein AAFV53_40605 [Myxococcota bacterium]
MPTIHGGKVLAQALSRAAVHHIFAVEDAPLHAALTATGFDITALPSTKAVIGATAGQAQATGTLSVGIIEDTDDSMRDIAQSLSAPMLHLFSGSGIERTDQIPEVMARAVRRATSGVMGPVFVEVSATLETSRVEADHLVWPGSGRLTLAPAGAPEQIEIAAGVMSVAQQPVVMVGAQWRTSPRRDALDDLLDAYDLPCFGPGGRGRRRFALSRGRALAQADVVVLFGANIGADEILAEDAYVIQVDRDPEVIGLPHSVDQGFHADVGVVMGQLAEAGQRRDDGWLMQLRALEDAARERIRSPFHSAVAAGLPRDVILINDLGADDLLEAMAPLRSGEQMLRTTAPGLAAGMAAGVMTVHRERPIVVAYSADRFHWDADVFQHCMRAGMRLVAVIRGSGDRKRGQRWVEAVGDCGILVEDPIELPPVMRSVLARASGGLIYVNIDSRAGLTVPVNNGSG